MKAQKAPAQTETAYSVADLLAVAEAKFHTTRDVATAALAGHQRLTVSEAKAIIAEFIKPKGGK